MTENLKTLDKKDVPKSKDDLDVSDAQVIELSDEQLNGVVGGGNKGYFVYNDSGNLVSIGSLPL